MAIKKEVESLINYLNDSNIITKSNIWAPVNKFNYQDYKSINVKDFGAKGDGVSDDTSAFKKALAIPGSKIVKIPSGTYKITSFLTVPSNTVVKGEGFYKTKLNFSYLSNQTYGNGGYCFKLSGELINASRLILEGYNKGSKSIKITDCTGVEIGDFIVVTQINDSAAVS